MRRGRQDCPAAAVLDPALECEHPRGDLQSRLCRRRQRLRRSLDLQQREGSRTDSRLMAYRTSSVRGSGWLHRGVAAGSNKQRAWSYGDCQQRGAADGSSGPA